MKRLATLLGLSLMITGTFAQTTFPVNGVTDQRPSVYALTNATIFKDYQTKLENATLIIDGGRVTQVGVDVSTPPGTIEIDLQGKYIYPGLIDPYTSYGLPEVEEERSRGPQYDSKRKQAFGWNDAVRPEYSAANSFSPNDKVASKWRNNGFTGVLTFRKDGIIRGTSSFVLTGDEPSQHMVIKPVASAHYSFDKGSSTQLYPTSIMGAVALIRQTYYDARWYQASGRQEQTNNTLDAFNDIQLAPQIFEANGGKLRVLLADKIGDEFGVQYIIKGNGDEYQRISEIKKTNARLIIPLTFPNAYDVDDPLEALDITFTDLKHWELAPANAAILDENGIEFAFTSDGLKNMKDFWPNVRKTLSYGLTESQALKALTIAPAEMLGLQSETGSLDPGKRANFFITSENIFNTGTKIYETWVNGRRYQMVDVDAPYLAGEYRLQVGNDQMNLLLDGDPGKERGTIKLNDTTEIKVDFQLDGSAVQMAFVMEEARYRLSGWLDGEGFKGTGKGPDEEWIMWSATNASSNEPVKSSDEGSRELIETGDIIYPFVAYGNVELPKQEDILIQNATVWTMEADGILENSDVLVRGGKIQQVGKDLPAGNARVIDGTGKHLTPGIIDEHSHAALSGVNESSHSITSEVRMYDAVNSEDINVYRQLAGGVVAAQLLHGSANPVGGQSALVKFRWGQSPDEMKIEGADGYIKFALGENVKQSNRSREWTTRFPQTRMGVEQVYVDGFTRAREYDAEWNKYNALSSKAKAGTTAPRRDLQLEALAEILNSERFISCHSYVQSEINMLMKVAEDFGFRVNTFTHILEGYKVADKMAEHGVGGSTFSDWWAYKYEVKEAIPYNAVLMQQAGVTVAINSDDREMARRLNQEAAKSIKYGGMEEIDALAMVTINPAKLLHLDDRMGSIKTGKDADLVLWDNHPLSIYARSELTLVDGTAYYEKAKNEAMMKYIQTERARIIAKMKDVKSNGGKTTKYVPKPQHLWSCKEDEENGHRH
jgi:imidazolonepropionase-like amidohydrolase